MSHVTSSRVRNMWPPQRGSQPETGPSRTTKLLQEVRTVTDSLAGLLRHCVMCVCRGSGWLYKRCLRRMDAPGAECCVAISARLGRATNDGWYYSSGILTVD